MGQYKGVPVESLCKKRLNSPSLVFVDSSEKRDSWDKMAENIKKLHSDGITRVSDVHSLDLGVKQHQLNGFDVLTDSNGLVRNKILYSCRKPK